MANITQRVVWTVLPNGVKQGGERLRASVLVSPRLMLANAVNPKNLSQFPAWLNWPATIEGTTFSVRVDGGPPVAATRVSAVRADVWQAIFRPTTFVRPYVFEDLRDRVILSYPVATLANAIESIYGEVGAASGADLMSRRDLRIAIYGRDFGPPRDPNDRRATAAAPQLGEPPPLPLEPRQVLELLRQGKRRADSFLRGRKRPRYETLKAALVGASPAYEPDKALDLFAVYHRPLQKEVGEERAVEHTMQGGNQPPTTKWKTHAKSAMLSANQFKDQIDFHQIVSSLIQYNELSRLCGLVVDLEIPATAVSAGLHKMTLQANWPKGGGQVQTDADVTPVINVDRKAFSFDAARELPSSAISGRYLRLEGGDYSLVQLDVDGAAMKVKNLAANLRLKDPDAPINEDSFQEKDKAPDKTGLPALRTAGLMLAQTRRDLALQALIYRSSELQDAVGGGQPVDELFAEDIIRGYRVDIHDATTQKWSSLFFRNIGFTLLNTGATHTTVAEEGMARLAGSESTDGDNADVLKMHEGLFAWRGWSLAAPEPGLIIEHRAGPVTDDIAPNDEQTPPGMPLKTVYNATPQTLPSLRFGRRYRVRVRLVDLAGASEPFAQQDLQPADAVSNPVIYKRHEPVEAPALALVQAGGAVEAPGDGESMGHLAIRTLNETPNLNTVAISDRSRRHVAQPRTSHRFAEQHGVMDKDGKVDASLYALLAGQDAPFAETVINIPGLPPALTPTPTSFAVAPEQFALPYLPDPLALGCAIRIFGVDGINPNTVYKVPFYGGAFNPNATPPWPKGEPFTIVLEDRGVNEAKFETATRRFSVSLKKAERAFLRLSCLMPKSALEIMAVADMIRKKKGPQALAALVSQIENGGHWMFTPWRTIVLTHAVQKPLVTPAFAEPIAASRKLGETIADIYPGPFPLNSKSTTRIDMKARWIEPLDNPTATSGPQAAGPVTRDHTDVAFTRPVARLEAPNDVFMLRSEKHAFPDTRYRRVLYRLDATTRFKEFMAPAIRTDESKLKVTSAEQVAWIPNAAPPPQPDLLYVVPTFGWSRSETGDRKTSMRAGGGIRVYLDRPWFETGFTEMLGVALPPTSPAPTEEALDREYKKSVTMWGADPIWAGGPIQLVSPPKTAFPLARWRAPITFEGTGFPAEEGTSLPPGDFRTDNLEHPEDASLRLSVAPHSVGYDPERKLYYADIVIRAPHDAYFPFIRLALVRYNPVSSVGAHLSPVVFAEFQQLTPDRLAVVTREAPNRVKVAVYGSTVPTQRWGSERLPITGVFGAEIQVLDPGADPDLGWRKVEEPAPAPGGLTAQPVGPAARVTPAPGLAAPSAPSPATRTAPPVAGAAAPSASAVREADALIAAGRYSELLARQDLTLVWQRPLLWEQTINLPPVQSGAKRRLMIVEAEVYQRGDAGPSNIAGGGERATIGGRVVYFETIDV